MIRVAFVGQTPPPFGGQAIMIEKALKGNYTKVKLFHIRMAFSKEMDEIGKANMFKVFHLFSVIARIYYTRIFKRATTLYYPPAGPDKVPVIRDIIILLSTRWLFKKVIFHFHAGGVSEMKINSLFFRTLYKAAYYNADCSIILSSLNPQDGTNLKAKKQVVMPYGIEDNFEGNFTKTKHSGPVKLLFVAIIKESKGILVLLESCKLLKEKGKDFRLQVMGKFESKEFEKKVKEQIAEWNIGDRVEFLGVLSGQKKFEAYNNADVFCFPTFFESETFGVVLLEAMQFSLPIVATRWRGIPSIITEGENGFLVEPKDAHALTDKLDKLITNEDLRLSIGQKGRHLFLSKFKLNVFHEQMEQLFVSYS